MGRCFYHCSFTGFVERDNQLPGFPAVCHHLNILTPAILAHSRRFWFGLVGPPKTRGKRERIVVVLKWFTVSGAVLVLWFETVG
jgi:hypothetical protein